MGNDFSKINIYNRLLQNAADMWGISSSEMDSIDPLAKMLLGSVAKEIEKIGHELYGSDARIFQRQAKYLIPEVLETAAPAHAVLKLAPIENNTVNEYDEFVFEKRWRNKKNFNKIEQTNLFFSPIGEFNTAAVALKYKIAGGQLYAMQDLQADSLGKIAGAQANEILLGFEVLEPGIKDLRLYFDWGGLAQKGRLFERLAGVRAFYQLENLACEHGLGRNAKTLDLRSEFSRTSKIEQSVRQYYSDRFITIDLEEKFEEPFVYDTEFLDQLVDAKIEQKTLKKLQWIRISFAPEFPVERIETAIVLPNCIPAINRKLEQPIFRLRKETNIKSLDFQGFFLELERLEASSGDEYVACPSLDMAVMKNGSYTFRNGGVARLDERNGHEYLNYMLDLLRDEKQAFSAIDLTSTVSDLGEIEKILHRVQKRINDADKGSNQPYVIIKPFEKNENAHVYFWSTNGALANDLKVGSVLKSKSPAYSKSGNVLLVSRTVGGSEEYDANELLEKYRSAILTRGMIVTRADIAQLCREICGKQLKDVSIENGLKSALGNGKGLMKTLDVLLVFANKKMEQEEEVYWIKKIESELELRSNLNLPVRILNREKSGTLV